MLGNEQVETSQPGEIVANADWYDYEAKYREGGMELVVPAPISAEQIARVRELAVEAFALGGCSGLARCDFFVEPDGAVLVNEINTMPGFTETSVYAKLWRGHRPRVPGPLRPPRRARGRAPPARPLLRVLSQRLAQQLDVADLHLVARRPGRGLRRPC